MEAPEDHPVLLFDGVCDLCNGVVRFLIERDEAATLRFAPLQSDVARELLAGRDPDPDDLETVVLVEDGRCFTKSGAALRVARHLGLPYRLLSSLRFVPRGLRDRVYDVVANRRYDWFGRRDRCMAPTPDVTERFLVDPRTGPAE
jgi:predicted DCC family thiol-disulfide oxidoreductase YuxK